MTDVLQKITHHGKQLQAKILEQTLTLGVSGFLL